MSWRRSSAGNAATTSTVPPATGSHSRAPTGSGNQINSPDPLRSRCHSPSCHSAGRPRRARRTDAPRRARRRPTGRRAPRRSCPVHRRRGAPARRPVRRQPAPDGHRDSRRRTGASSSRSAAATCSSSPADAAATPAATAPRTTTSSGSGGNAVATTVTPAGSGSPARTRSPRPAHPGLDDRGDPTLVAVGDEQPLDAGGIDDLAGGTDADRAAADQEDRRQRNSGPSSSRHPPLIGGTPPLPRQSQEAADKDRDQRRPGDRAGRSSLWG